MQIDIRAERYDKDNRDEHSQTLLMNAPRIISFKEQIAIRIFFK